MPGRCGFGLPRETGRIVVVLDAGIGFGIGIAIDHKVENIFSNLRLRQRPRFRGASAVNGTPDRHSLPRLILLPFRRFPVDQDCPGQHIVYTANLHTGLVVFHELPQLSLAVGACSSYVFGSGLPYLFQLLFPRDIHSEFEDIIHGGKTGTAAAAPVLSPVRIHLPEISAGSLENNTGSSVMPQERPKLQGS